MSISNKLSKSEIERIYSGANTAVWHSHFHAEQFSKRTTREEDYVASLIIKGVPLLAERWADILNPKKIGLKVSGVFCHGRPQVDFAPVGAPVELADLLVVHIHATKSKSTAKALLVQAKMSDDGKHTLAANDRQLQLFSNWPTFKFTDSSMGSNPRSLGKNGKGSRYALIRKAHNFPEDISWPDLSPWLDAKANKYLDGTQSFPKTLGNILLGFDGRAVNLKKPTNDWSKLIKELLQKTGAKTFNRANLGIKDTARLTESVYQAGLTLFIAQSQNFSPSMFNGGGSFVESNFFQNAKNYVGNGGGDRSKTDNEENPESGGISSLIIETQELE